MNPDSEITKCEAPTSDTNSSITTDLTLEPKLIDRLSKIVSYKTGDLEQKGLLGEFSISKDLGDLVELSFKRALDNTSTVIHTVSLDITTGLLNDAWCNSINGTQALSDERAKFVAGFVVDNFEVKGKVLSLLGESRNLIYESGSTKQLISAVSSDLMTFSETFSNEKYLVKRVTLNNGEYSGFQRDNESTETVLPPEEAERFAGKLVDEFMKRALEK